MRASVLSEVVTRGGLALQAEDCSIRAAVHHRGERGGLLHLQNERFYQFIVWRAILPVFHAVVEREDSCDLVVGTGENRHYFEMKNWMTTSGDLELPKIQRDVGIMQSRNNGHILVFSANPPEVTEDNLSYFVGKIGGLELASREISIFHTEDQKGSPRHFWIAGWRVAPAGDGSKPQSAATVTPR